MLPNNKLIVLHNRHGSNCYFECNEGNKTISRAIITNKMLIVFCDKPIKTVTKQVLNQELV